MIAKFFTEAPAYRIWQAIFAGLFIFWFSLAILIIKVMQ